jgi:hypothetical protein
VKIKELLVRRFGQNHRADQRMAPLVSLEAPRQAWRSLEQVLNTIFDPVADLTPFVEDKVKEISKWNDLADDARHR